MACVSYCWDEGCIGGCVGGCSGGCSDDGCAGSCGDGCSGCTGCTSCRGCSGCTGCTNTCKNECNKGCTSEEMESLYARLRLEEYIKANNIQDIIDFVGHEVLRRDKIPILDVLNQQETITLVEYFQNIKSNLQSIDFTPTKPITKNDYILTEMGQELIDKAKEAYNTVIPLS